MLKMLEAMLQGSLISIEIFVLTLLFSLPLALPVALGRMSRSRLISGAVNVYLLIMRELRLFCSLFSCISRRIICSRFRTTGLPQ